MRKTTLLSALLLAAAASAAGAGESPRLTRTDFNRLAASAHLPLFWMPVDSDTATLRPLDLVAVRDAAALERYVSKGRFTPEFELAYRGLVETRRREAVRKELEAGRPNLILTDLREAPGPDRLLARHLVSAGALIDELFSKQMGGWRWREAASQTDPESRTLFERNHSPWCEAPATENDPFCNAVPSFPPRKSGLYPESLSHDSAMCESLRSMPEGKDLLDPFTVVVERGGKLAAAPSAKGERPRSGDGNPLVAAPLTEVYGETMKAVARELRAAAAAQGRGEAALSAYLLAAAGGFETGDWSAADEAWSRMNGRNSRWYLRIAPDETQFDPCQEKAGFHVSFARIDPASLAWQDRLTPLRQEMEDALSSLIGPPYPARKVSFSLPDFIEIVLNSGDSRHGLGATIGQSLPNWGKVAEEGRRRTVVMTNLYEDPDSKKTAREKAAWMLDAGSLAYYPADKEPGLVSTILHEAAHNLGPHSDSRVGGRTPSEIFGGRVEGVLEELKAQTAALWYLDFLLKKGLLTPDQVRRSYAHDIVWCLGHISNGMTTDTGAPKPYSQLSAVQIGTFLRSGALRWSAGEDAVERLSIDFDRLPAAVEGLMREVGRIKASGDADAAKALLSDFVTGEGSRLVRMKDVSDRLRRFPKESYSYTVLY